MNVCDLRIIIGRQDRYNVYNKDDQNCFGKNLLKMLFLLR